MKTYKGYQEFFQILDKIDSDIKEFSKNGRGDWNSSRETGRGEYCHDNTPKSQIKKYKENPFLSLGKTTVSCNTGDYSFPVLFLWFTLPNYNKGVKYEDIWEKSDKLKVILDKGSYKFCILRDHLSRPTETYWGHRFETKKNDRNYPHKLAILDKKDKVIFSCCERWEFVNFCEGIVHEEYQPETPSEIFRYFNPFKVFIKPFKTTESIDELSRRLEFHINNPIDIWKEICKKKDKDPDDVKDKWLVILMGMNDHNHDNFRDHNATWFIMSSKTKPTTDEALYYLMEQIDFYDEEDAVDLFTKMKKDYEFDMNNVNFLLEERLRYLWSEKVKYKLQSVLDVKYKDLKKFWDDNIVH